MSLPDYELRRSKRRTLSIEISREARIIVRAPMAMERVKIEEFIASHLTWIEKKLSEVKLKLDLAPELSGADIAELKKRALEELLPLTSTYAEIIGVMPNSVKISSAKARFGSCSKRGNINYSYRLMLYPKEAWDYIVVHELCHLLHFDHSKAFWQAVERYLPNYREIEKLLK